MIKGFLIGKGISYSYSKNIHEGIGLANYSICDCDNLNDFFNKDLDYDFFNVTIPYKKEIIKYLDVLDPISINIGAVNLVIKRGNKLFGYNSDYYGFLMFLKKNDINFENKRIGVLGTGGASQVVQRIALEQNAKSLIVVSREEYKYYDNFITYDELNNYCFDILINATPVGTSPNINESLIDFDKLKVNPNLVCIDLIYNPYNTKFLIDAKNHGYNAYNGIDMLIYQAIYSYYFIDESYHNYIYDDELIDKIRKNIDYRNVIIIGMPFSGKSTYGKQFALDNNLELFDIDEIIEMKYGKINDIFENYGEEYFRNIEKSVIKELSKKNNSVIVPGGGAIIDNDNLINLKSNGYFIFLDTDIDDLIDRSKNDTTRPLVKNKEDLIKLYNERHKIYLNCADIVIKNK